MEKSTKKIGRPPKSTEVKKIITIHIPLDVLEAIDGLANNRTEWIVEALRERLERGRTDASYTGTAL